MALEAAEKPHTEHGWSDMMHRWESDGHAHPEIEEEDLSKEQHDDEHWTIMDTFKLEKLFESIDVDGDGQVTKKEWEDALKEWGSYIVHHIGDRTFKRYLGSLDILDPHLTGRFACGP